MYTSNICVYSSSVNSYVKNNSIKFTCGIEGSLNLSTVLILVPLHIFGAGLLGLYVPGGGAQPKMLNILQEYIEQNIISV